MERLRNTFGPLICYHGCPRQVAEDVLANKATLAPSTNKWDWLGRGIYFWVDSWARGLDWAIERKFDEPYVIGAYVHPGLCLNLTDYAVIDQLKSAYELLCDHHGKEGAKLPVNKGPIRRLDCAVVEFLHAMREDRNLPAYQTTLGAFEEGDPVFEGSSFRHKTHLQLLVREGYEDRIIGYFRVPGIEEAIEKVRE